MQKNLFWTKILVAVMMMAGGNQVADAQMPIHGTTTIRHHEFAKYILKYARLDALGNITNADLEKAKNRNLEHAQHKLAQLQLDSAKYANDITHGAKIINNPEFANQDFLGMLIEIENASPKNTELYQIRRNIKQYEKTLKKISLARFVIER